MNVFSVIEHIRDAIRRGEVTAIAVATESIHLAEIVLYPYSKIVLVCLGEHMRVDIKRVVDFDQRRCLVILEPGTAVTITPSEHTRTMMVGHVFGTYPEKLLQDGIPDPTFQPSDIAGFTVKFDKLEYEEAFEAMCRYCADHGDAWQSVPAHALSRFQRRGLQKWNVDQGWTPYRGDIPPFWMATAWDQYVHRLQYGPHKLMDAESMDLVRICARINERMQGRWTVESSEIIRRHGRAKQLNVKLGRHELSFLITRKILEAKDPMDALVDMVVGMMERWHQVTQEAKHWTEGAILRMSWTE